MVYYSKNVLYQICMFKRLNTAEKKDKGKVFADVGVYFFVFRLLRSKRRKLNDSS